MCVCVSVCVNINTLKRNLLNKNILEFRFKFFWNLPLMVQLSPVGRQAITWTKADRVYRRMYAALVGDELIHNERHFTDDVYQIIFLYILIRTSSNILPKCSKTKSEIGFIWKDIIWANDGLDYWRMYPQLGLDNSSPMAHFTETKWIFLLVWLTKDFKHPE